MKWLTRTYVAIIAIALLETIALLKGVNGAVMVAAFSSIAGLGGYALGKTVAVSDKQKETERRLRILESRRRKK